MEKDNQKDIDYKPALFQYEPDFFTLYKRIQNLSSAIFMVTDSIMDIHDNEIKSALRQGVLDCLFELSNSIAGSEPLFEALRRLGAGLLNINALLEIAFWTKLVFKNNFDILQTEIQKTYSLTNDLLSRYASRFALESSFFGEHLEKRPEEVLNSYQGQIYKGQKDKRTRSLEKPITPGFNRENEDKNIRREAILKLLRQKDNLSVKDISSVVTGYSEKTIQRELILLMSEGLVTRQGKRRWSTYSISILK